MPVHIHENSRTFHLTSNHLSYIFRVMENEQLEHLYYGARLHDRESFDYLHEETMRSQMSVNSPEPSLLSMQYTKQEMPVYGTGDYREGSLCIRQKNGSRISDFRYQSYEVVKGKPSLPNLPATYTNVDDEAETLKIYLFDEVSQTEMILSYTIFRNLPVITRHTELTQKSEEEIRIETIMSASVEWNDMDFDLISLSGGWARERYIKRRALEMGFQGVGGLAGTTGGAEQNPFLALVRKNTDENQGEAYGFSLVYSGNFLAKCDVSTFDMTRLMMGIHPQNFEWVLKKDETFTSPEVVMVYSRGGLGDMSRTFHDLYKNNLMRGRFKNKVRPILLNNWEATYFDFTEEKLLTIAQKAKEVGVELFVLDDGWFGARNDDYRGLGDWVVNLKKLPSGISGLSKKINDMGLQFGLWVELEMVNKDSDLYRSHPDWIISTPGRFESHARHQHVLDFSKDEVVDYIFEMVAKILRESSISYIKWDMNRYMTEPYNGEVMHRYILGVYRLYDRLTTEFPEILFESCASGGARFDPGLMYYAPQTWTSDDTDAHERTKIQYGTSFVYPLVSMGSHVSAVPNHQLHRITPLESRANIAYFGTFGYELDLNLLSDDEIKAVKEQITFMKKYRELIQVDGRLYRLLSPFPSVNHTQSASGNEMAWMVVSSDKKTALAAFYQSLNKVNASWLRLRLKGLDTDTLYRVEWDHEEYHEAYGDELMNAGIPINRELLNQKGGDFASIIFKVEALNA